MDRAHAHTLLGDLVRECSPRAHVLERFGIDYFCGGARTLAQACATQHLELQRVCGALAGLDATLETDGWDWPHARLQSLIDHIVATHHQFARSELSRLGFLVNDVSKAHGTNHPELFLLRDELQIFAENLLAHMAMEETLMFPWMCRMESSFSVLTDPGNSLNATICRAEKDHRHLAEALARMRSLTSGFKVPHDACPKYRELFEGLAEFEADLHAHLHKENNILFPRAVELAMDES